MDNPPVLIPPEELTFTYLQAAGPGGQNVNKVASAVELRYDLRGSPSLTEDVKKRLIKLSGRRVTGEGVLVIEARRYRSQLANRADALLRLNRLVKKALLPPTARKPTRPGAAAKAARLGEKKQRGEVKRRRRKVQPDWD